MYFSDRLINCILAQTGPLKSGHFGKFQNYLVQIVNSEIK